MFDLTVEQAFAYRVNYEQTFEWVTNKSGRFGGRAENVSHPSDTLRSWVRIDGPTVNGTGRGRDRGQKAKKEEPRCHDI